MIRLVHDDHRGQNLKQGLKLALEHWQSKTARMMQGRRLRHRQVCHPIPPMSSFAKHSEE
jgi:hypothetical protein